MTSVNYRKIQWPFWSALLWIFIVSAPFLGARGIRFTGDEKTYLVQALEMFHRGTGFFQTYAYEPNYYKGPLHYLLLLAGLKVFGLKSWVAHFMNEIFLLLGSLSVFKLIARRTPGKTELAFFFSVAFSTSLGILTYLYSSQMELELIGLFALALLFLDLEMIFSFWITAGICGLAKSPLHSVLLGLGAVIWWGINGDLKKRLLSKRQWIAVIIGILVCLAGYAPAYFGDREHFVSFYVFRETFDKPGNLSAWWGPLVSFFFEAPMPWLPVLILSSLGRWRLKPRSLVTLGISVMIPCLAFFLYHPYRVKNYDYPALVGLFVAVAGALIEGGSFVQARIARVQSVFLVILAFICLAVITWIPGPAGLWPPTTWLTLSALFALLGITLLRSQKLGYHLALAAGLFSLLFNSILHEFGAFELHGLQALRTCAHCETRPLAYSNLKHNVWNEWGLLSFEIEEPILPLYADVDVKQALTEKRPIIVSDPEEIPKLQEALKKLGYTTPLHSLPWSRWSKHTSWKEWFHTKRWELLQSPYFVIFLK